MSQSWIDCQTVIINSKNVNEFLRSHTTGMFDVATNIISDYRFVVGDDLTGPVRDRVVRIIDRLNAEHDITIAHETQHLQNRRKIGDFVEFAHGNYFQEMSLYCLDELSAFAGGILRGDPVLAERGTTPETVAVAMNAGVQEFINGTGCTFYLDGLSQQLTDAVFVDLFNRDTRPKVLKKQCSMYRNAPESLFGPRFYRAVNQLFTYDDYCIFNDAKLAPPVRNLMAETQCDIKRVNRLYLDKTLSVLENYVTPRCCRTK